MTDNPKTYEVILLDHAEPKHDQSGEYLAVYNLNGIGHKVNVNHQNLWGVFLNSPEGTPILLTFESFTPENSKTPITYISNAQVADFDAFWKAGIQSTLKRLLTAQDDDRMRSQALSYAKDLAVAQITVTAPSIPDSDKIVKLATTFFYFIKGKQDTEIPNIEIGGKEVIEEEASK